MSTKVATMKVINQKIDFLDRGSYAVRNNEVYIPGISLGWGNYSDTGYRFRYNTFERFDNWYAQIQTLNIFFDYKFYNSDTFDVPEETEIAAEMYFRLDVDQITHGRVVFSLMDFIGELGGVSDFVLMVSSWVIGGYAAFHASIVTMSVLYRVRRPPDQKLFTAGQADDQIESDIENIKFTLCTKVMLYFH